MNAVLDFFEVAWGVAAVGAVIVALVFLASRLERP